MTATQSIDRVTNTLVQELDALRTENEQLRTALQSRIIIEQAKGAISASLEVDPATAFEMLRGLARSQRREIHEYAAEVVTNRGRLDSAATPHAMKGLRQR